MVKKIVKKKTKTVKKVAVKKPIKVAVKAKPEIVTASYDSRINRIFGQVGGVKKMIEGKKDRVELLIQLKAVRSAIKALEAEVLQDHLQVVVGDLSGSVAQRSKKIAELKKIFVKFE